MHDMGLVVWHNVNKISNLVVINPQWMADAMAQVVSFISEITEHAHRGVINWTTMQASLKLKYACN